ncbi:MAG TPA: hypothetical protein VEC57_16495 [Candidatus Limnocylindrales bacterium]|nr:hypothetical protein [Candidatus Limnocylindrales bacterium]
MTVLRTSFSRRLRQLAASLGLLAMTVQAGLPALHVEHQRHSAPAAASTDAAGAWQAHHAATEHGSRHDDGSCAVCRISAHSKSLGAPTCTSTPVPHVASQTLRHVSRSARSQIAARCGTPRAPPFHA